MISYDELQTMQTPFNPVDLGSIQFSINSPIGIQGKDIKLCRCIRCCKPNRNTNWYTQRGLSLQHGDRITEEKVRYAFELFHNTRDYTLEMDPSIHMFHIMLLMHKGMYICRGVEGQDDPDFCESWRPNCWWRQCVEAKKHIWCWIKHTYFTQCACACKKHCDSILTTNKKGLDVYLLFGAMTFSDGVITTQLIYRVSQVLFDWISQPEFDGPPRLLHLAGRYIEYNMPETKTGKINTNGMGETIMIRKLMFLSKQELEFPFFLHDHLGKTAIFSDRPKRHMGNLNLYERMLLITDELHYGTG